MAHTPLLIRNLLLKHPQPLHKIYTLKMHFPLFDPLSSSSYSTLESRFPNSLPQILNSPILYSNSSLIHRQPPEPLLNIINQSLSNTNSKHSNNLSIEPHTQTTFNCMVLVRVDRYFGLN